MEEQEDKVRAFKASHFGDLPSEMQTNVQILSGLQGQLQSTQRDVEAAKQQKLYLDSLLQEYDSQLASADSGASTLEQTNDFDQRLKDLRLRLADARSKYTDQYPDVIILQDEISKTEKLKQQQEEKIASDPKPNKKSEIDDVGGSKSSPTIPTPPMMQIESQLKVNERETSNLQQSEKEIEAQISAYQARLNLTPKTEEELAEVSRGYEESSSNYNSLLQKQMQSQLATNLEQRQQGEQFSILDPPSLPAKPASPNHLKVSLSGLLVGIALGMGFAALVEMTQQRVWKSTDLEGLVPTKVLVAIPHLSTPNDHRFRAGARFIKFAVTTAIILLILAGNLYALYRG